MVAQGGGLGKLGKFQKKVDGLVKILGEVAAWVRIGTKSKRSVFFSKSGQPGTIASPVKACRRTSPTLNIWTFFQGSFTTPQNDCRELHIFWFMDYRKFVFGYLGSIICLYISVSLKKSIRDLYSESARGSGYPLWKYQLKRSPISKVAKGFCVLGWCVTRTLINPIFLCLCEI